MAGMAGNAEVKLRVALDGQNKVIQGLSAIGRATTHAGGAASRVQAGMAGLRNGVSSLASTLGLGRLAMLGFGAAAGFAAASGMKSFASIGVQAAASAETARVSFETMLGSAEQANQFMEQIEQLAASTPFEMQGLTDSSKKLLAFRFEAAEIIPMLRTLGDASAGLGAGTEGIDRMVRAMGQIKAKGKATAEDLMQLTEMGIPVWDMLAEKSGKTTAQIQDDVSRGVVDAETTISSLLEGMNNRFGGLMDKQAATYDGKMSTLKDTFTMTAKEFMEPFMEPMKGAVGSAIEKLDTVKAWFKDEWPGVISEAGETWDGFTSLFPDFGPVIDRIKTSFLSGFEPFQPALDRIQEAWDKLVTAFTGLAPDAEGAAGGMFAALVEGAAGIASLFGTAIGIAAGVIADVFLPVITTLLTWLGPPILGVIQGFSALVKGAFEMIGGIVTWLRDTIFAPLFNTLLANFPSMGEIADKAGSIIKAAGEGIGQGLDMAKAAFDAVLAAGKAAWDGLKSAFNGAASWLRSTFIDPLTSGVNSVITTINKIPGVDIPTLPTGGGSSGGSPSRQGSIPLSGGSIPLSAGIGAAHLLAAKSAIPASVIPAGGTSGTVTMHVHLSAIDGPSVGRFFADHRDQLLSEVELAVARGRARR